MVALFTLLAVVAISIAVTRVATVALQQTGLSEEAARFQARSAFTGTGFTTDEAESVVGHPVRRRIVMILMILQNAGIVTAVSTGVLSFVGTAGAGEALRRGGVLVIGLALLVLLARSRWVDRAVSPAIEWALDRFTDLRVTDYYTLLHVQEGYTVSRFRVRGGTWLAGARLSALGLPDEGVLVLGVIREDGSYIGVPRGRYTIHEGDTLVLYGERERLAELNERLAGPGGEAAHDRAREEHEEALESQDREERARGRGVERTPPPAEGGRGT